jgi:hypothetical protein
MVSGLGVAGVTSDCWGKPYAVVFGNQETTGILPAGKQSVEIKLGKWVDMADANSVALTVS